MYKEIMCFETSLGRTFFFWRERCAYPCELSSLWHKAEVEGQFSACHTELQSVFLLRKGVVHGMIKNFRVCDWTGGHKRVEKGYNLHLLYSLLVRLGVWNVAVLPDAPES